MMKSPMCSFSLIFLGVAPLILFSCTRAVDNEKTSVTITLPNSQAIKRFSSNLTTLAEPAAETTIEPAPVSNEYAPEPSDPTEYETNCYLVAVSYPEDLANRNYCGTKDVAAGDTIDDASVTQTFKFSQNFVGLVGPDTTQIELADILIGPNRTFTVIAVPTTDPKACLDLLTEPLAKGSMLKPRKVGSVTTDVLVTGDPINLVIDTSNPVANYDECVITDTKLNYPNADKIVIDQENFPFNYMRKPGTGFICQPLKVGLLANLSGLQRDVPGALNFDSSVSVARKSVGGTTYELIKTFNNQQSCMADTNGVEAFTFPRNRPSKLRWVQVASDVGAALYYKAYSNEASPEVSTSVPALFKFGTAASYVLDHNIPRVFQLDVCYKASTTIRSISGGSTGVSGPSLTLSNSGTAGLKFFTAAADCDSNSNAVATVTIPSSSRGVEYWIKASSILISAGSRIDYYLTQGTGTIAPTGDSDDPFNPRIRVYTSAQTQADQLAASGMNALGIDQVGYASAFPKLDIPNVAGGCFPVSININNRLGAVIASNPGYVDFDFKLKTGTTVERFENVPLRYQPIDVARDGDVGGYSIISMGNPVFNSNPCTQYSGMQAFPVSPTSTGTPMFNSSGTSFTFFISPTGQGGVGRRRIQIYYGGTNDGTTIGYPVGQIDFELTAP